MRVDAKEVEAADRTGGHRVVADILPDLDTGCNGGRCSALKD